jgi:hypothetical protein
VAIVAMATLARFTVDDSFISYRYARNLASGAGLVFNPGERVEGYTNFAWTVLLSAGYRVGLEPDGLAKVLGATSALGAIAVCHRLSVRALPKVSLPPVSTWLIATSPVLLGHSVFGLETGAFACLMIAGTAMLFAEESRASADRARVIPWSGVVFALGGLTRPEAPLFAGVAMLFLAGPTVSRRLAGERQPLWMLVGLTGVAISLYGWTLVGARGPRVEPSLWRLGAPALALAAVPLVLGATPRAVWQTRNLVRGTFFAVPVGAHLLWRHAYYGSWLPNTLGAKTAAPQQIAGQLARGKQYVENYLSFEGAILWFALFAVAWAVQQRNREVLCITAVAVLGSVYTVLVGGDWMKLWRFMAHIQPFWLLLAGIGARVLWQTRERWLRWALVAWFALSLDRRYETGLERTEFARLAGKDFLAKSAAPLSNWFAAREAEFGREAVVGRIAMADIGAVAWHTDYPITDLLGLVDPTIAALPGGYRRKTGRPYRDHVFAERPRYHLTVSARNDCFRPSHATAKPLMNDSRYHSTYEVAGIVQFPKSRWCIFERRESAARMRELGAAYPAPARISPRPGPPSASR